jgi:ribose 5-phosphate isomerase B
MGGRLLDQATMEKIVDTWLATPFEGGRHEARVKKIDAIRESYHPEKNP